MRSLYDGIKFVASLVAATRTADADGTGVDTKGFNSAVAVIQAGDIDLASTDETYAFKIGESDDNSTFKDVTGLTTTVTTDNQTKLIRIEGLGTSRKRYLRVSLDVGGTTPSIPCSAVIALGNAYQEPVNA